MQQSSSFLERIVGALRLDRATYEEVEHDTDATWQAVAVVAISGILSGIGASAGRTENIFAGVVVGIIVWAIFALFAYIVGAYLLPGPETSATFGQVLRALGFAYAPSFFTILGLIPGIGVLILFITAIWSLIASVIALSQSLEVGRGRAVAIAIVAFLAMVLVLVLIVAVFGISIGLLDVLMSRAG